MTDMERHLNIIAFNIPWPPNSGGVIDVYYKMKALHRCGVKIVLHCFEYERAHSPELEAICEKVYYYKRHTGLRANITLLPPWLWNRPTYESIRPAVVGPIEPQAIPAGVLAGPA